MRNSISQSSTSVIGSDSLSTISPPLSPLPLPFGGPGSGLPGLLFPASILISILVLSSVLVAAELSASDPALDSDVDSESANAPAIDVASDSELLSSWHGPLPKGGDVLRDGRYHYHRGNIRRLV